jgi:hypothetical protein
MLFSKEKTELQARIAELEQKNAEATASLATITAERDAANARCSTMAAEHATAITALNAEHANALAAKDTEVDAKVNQGVIDAMAAIGVPESQLPARAKGAATNDFDAQIEDLNARIAEAKDPLEKGKLASQVIDLMEKKAAAAKS